MSSHVRYMVHYQVRNHLLKKIMVHRPCVSDLATSQTEYNLLARFVMAVYEKKLFAARKNLYLVGQ